MSARSYSFEVYTKANCFQCRLTKKWLKSHGTVFVEKPAEEHLEMLQEAGVLQAPGVAFLVDGKAVLVWSGFRPGLMSELLNASVAAVKG